MSQTSTARFARARRARRRTRSVAIQLARQAFVVLAGDNAANDRRPRQLPAVPGGASACHTRATPRIVPAATRRQFEGVRARFGPPPHLDGSLRPSMYALRVTLPGGHQALDPARGESQLTTPCHVPLSARRNAIGLRAVRPQAHRRSGVWHGVFGCATPLAVVRLPHKDNTNAG